MFAGRRVCFLLQPCDTSQCLILTRVDGSFGNLWCSCKSNAQLLFGECVSSHASRNRITTLPAVLVALKPFVMQRVHQRLLLRKTALIRPLRMSQLHHCCPLLQRYNNPRLLDVSTSSRGSTLVNRCRKASFRNSQRPSFLQVKASIASLGTSQTQIEGLSIANGECQPSALHFAYGVMRRTKA